MTTTPPQTPHQQPDDADERQPEPRKPSAAAGVIAAVIVGVALVGFVSCVASMGGSDTEFQVTDVQMGTSAAGRLEIAFAVTNSGDEYGKPSCTVRAEDADGFRVGSDIVTGQVGVAPGRTERYSGITGIDAADVARATVECD